MFNIYVVDEDPITREMIQANHDPEHNITCFNHAGSCLEALEHETPDLFLIEVKLPDMNGYDLCRKIRSIPRFPGPDRIHLKRR